MTKPKTWSRKGRCPSCRVSTGSKHATACQFNYTARGCDYCGDRTSEPIRAWPSPSRHWPHIYLHVGDCWDKFAADQKDMLATARQTRAEYLATIKKS